MQNVSKELRIPLMRAMRAGNAEEIRKLINRAPKDVEFGESPTMWACDAGNIDAIELCVERFGPHPYAPGRSGPLHMAAVRGDAQATQALVSAGADPNAINQDGHSPLQWAVCEHSVGWALPSDLTPKDFGKCVEILLGAGANPHARDETGNTPLMTSIARSDRVPFPALAKASDHTALNKAGRSALDLAHETGSAWAIAEMEGKLLSRIITATNAPRARRL